MGSFVLSFINDNVALKLVYLLAWRVVDKKFLNYVRKWYPAEAQAGNKQPKAAI